MNYNHGFLTGLLSENEWDSNKMISQSSIYKQTSWVTSRQDHRFLKYRYWGWSLKTKSMKHHLHEVFRNVMNPSLKGFLFRKQKCSFFFSFTESRLVSSYDQSFTTTNSQAQVVFEVEYLLTSPTTDKSHNYLLTSPTTFFVVHVNEHKTVLVYLAESFFDISTILDLHHPGSDPEIVVWVSVLLVPRLIPSPPVTRTHFSL